MTLHLNLRQLQHGISKEDMPHNPRREAGMSPGTDYATTGYDAQVATPEI
jgi:hypothetical protein